MKNVYLCIISNQNIFRMEKIITIYLGGNNYRFTESAYKLLMNYDRFLNKKYKDPEFLLDIETQMSAILDVDIKDKEQVIEYHDVEEAIRLIGQNENIKYSAGSYNPPKTNKIYRNSKKRFIGGVASGFSDYLNIDVVIIRALFVALTVFFGPGLLIYLALWVVLPSDKKIPKTKPANSMIKKSKNEDK